MECGGVRPDDAARLEGDKQRLEAGGPAEKARAEAAEAAEAVEAVEAGRLVEP